MTDNIQPAFWLEVKKEYIIENFDKMLSYLEQYRYCEDGDNASFISTSDCLRDFVHEIFDQTGASNLCHVLRYEGLSEKMLVRIVAAYLLVCHKTGRQDLKCLSLLASRMVLTGEVTTSEMIENMRMLQMACMRGQNVVKYAFGWNAIRDEDSLNLNHFAFTLAATEFDDVSMKSPLCYENKGVAIITGDRLRIAPMNFCDYKKTGVQVQFTIAGDTDVCVDKKDRARLDSFEKLVGWNTSLMYQQRGVKPSPARILKVYDLGDDSDVLVRITRADMNSVYAETIDSAYVSVEGMVYIPPVMYSVQSVYIREYLSPGMIIRVRLQDNDNIPFRITEPFDRYYRSLAEHSSFNTMSAVFFKMYGAGYSWMTENGLIVNIKDGNDVEDVRTAVEDGTPLEVTVLEPKVLYNDKFVVNGRYAMNNFCDCDCSLATEFMRNAAESLIEGFVDECESEYIPRNDDDDTVMLEDASCVLPMAYVLFERASRCYISTTDRYENLMAALMIAQLCDAGEDALFISHEMNFLSKLVGFAQGEEPGRLSLSHDPVLEGNSRVEIREKIVEVLADYEEDVITGQNVAGDNDDVLSNVSDLVHASNILLHKINSQEINRIKKNITAVLGVGDMFKHNEESSTYYGEENDTLEFKSSVVFPPVNKRENVCVPAEPQRQMWNILKTVCGFLNSMSGGELLVGVSDNGYSCGVQADIDYLFENGRIAERSMDRYIQYIKYSVDYAFCDNSGTAAEATEITTSRVRYVSETNKEDIRILRIQISPYEYGVVEFANKDMVPEDMSTSYMRSSNTTMPLNKEMKQQIEKNKLSERADADTQKVMNLQKARRMQRAVVLKGYSSKSGTRDRNVEAYKILLARNAVICYDIDRNGLREYKITRFDEVVITDRKWKHFRPKYNDLGIDLFDMLEGENPGTEIVLKLGRLPYNLILEECSGAERFLSPNRDADADRFPWVLSTTVFGMYGVGRFYMGLARDIRIVKGDELKKYVKDYIAGIGQDL